MNTLRFIGRILFVASWCLTTSVFSAPNSGGGERVSLEELIAKPDKYHGKVVRVVAYIMIDFENMTACPSENNTQMKRCLWLDIVNGPYKTEQDYARYQSKLQIWNRFKKQTVAIRATFDKDEKGHFSMWPGGLRKVIEVTGRKECWSFATNVAVPNNCMTGK